MDEFTKAKVRRAMIDNPGLPIKMIIQAIRIKQKAFYELKGFASIPNTSNLTDIEIDYDI